MRRPYQKQLRPWRSIYSPSILGVLCCLSRWHSGNMTLDSSLLLDVNIKLYVVWYFWKSAVIDILHCTQHLPEFAFSPLHFEGKFSGHVSQYARYVHSCLELSSWLKRIQITLVGSQWLLNFLSTQAYLAAKALFDRRFKNHALRM